MIDDNKKRDEVCKKYASRITEEFFPNEDVESLIAEILEEMYKEIKE